MNDLLVIPSTLTQLDRIPDSTPNDYGTCFYVFAEDGKWEASKELYKLGARWDGSGWLVEYKHKEALEDFCNRTEMIFVEYPLSEPFENTGYNASVGLFTQQLEVTEREIRLLINKYKIDAQIVNIDDLLLEHNWAKLGETTDGIKVQKLLHKYNDWQKKLTTAINQKQYKDLLIKPAHLISIDNQSFEYLLKNNSEQELINELQNISPGIATGYTIGDIDLNFPGGAISIIAAPTSHGKTTALINFILGALEKNPEKSIHFFTYEESKASILLLFINTWISTQLSTRGTAQLSKNNRKSIETYFRDNTTEYITKGVKPLFETYKKQFFEQLIDSGRLKIIYSDMPANELIGAINYIKKNNANLGLVSVDYMQLLKMPTSSKLGRQEELKQICLMLKDCAIATGLPIVLAAQFNRTVMAEADLSPISIGEAGDIERVASLIIGMFNRKFTMHRNGNVDKDGNTIQPEDSIFFEVLKGRNIGNGHSSIMDFDGNKGIISQPQQSNDVTNTISESIF